MGPVEEQASPLLLALFELELALLVSEIVFGLGTTARPIPVCLESCGSGPQLRRDS